MPQDLLQQLQGINGRLDNIGNRLDTMNDHLHVNAAQTFNLRATNRNARLQAPNELAPLQKTVGSLAMPYSHIVNAFLFQIVGSGRNLALALIGNFMDAGAFANHFPGGAPVHAIGDLPPNFNPKVEGYKHIDILRLIVFYNENFGIVAADTIANRNSKFRRFLTEF